MRLYYVLRVVCVKLQLFVFRLQCSLHRHHEGVEFLCRCQNRLDDLLYQTRNSRFIEYDHRYRLLHYYWLHYYRSIFYCKFGYNSYIIFNKYDIRIISATITLTYEFISSFCLRLHLCSVIIA